MTPASNSWPGVVFIYLFLCDLDKCGLFNMAKMNEPIISRQDIRQADCFDLQGYVNKYQWHVLFFRLLCVSYFRAAVDGRLWIHLLLLSFKRGHTVGMEGKQGERAVTWAMLQTLNFVSWCRHCITPEMVVFTCQEGTRTSPWLQVG